MSIYKPGMSSYFQLADPTTGFLPNLPTIPNNIYKPGGAGSPRFRYPGQNNYPNVYNYQPNDPFTQIYNFWRSGSPQTRTALFNDLPPHLKNQLLRQAQQEFGKDPNFIMTQMMGNDITGSLYKPGQFGNEFSQSARYMPGASGQPYKPGSGVSGTSGANPYEGMTTLYRDANGMLHDPGDNPIPPPGQGGQAPNPYINRFGGWSPGGGRNRGQGSPANPYLQRPTPGLNTGTPFNPNFNMPNGRPATTTPTSPVAGPATNPVGPRTQPTAPQAPNPTTHPGLFGRDPNDPYKPNNNNKMRY